MRVLAAGAATVVFCITSAAQSPEAPLLRQSLGFSGMTWNVKDSGPRKVGPGPNWFSAGNVNVDAAGGLHLRATNRGGACVAAEVVLVPSLGYGTYEFTVDSNLGSLAKNLVLGLFIWDDTPSDPYHREMDIEIGRWGREDNGDAQFVIQPYDIPDNMVRFRLPTPVQRSVHRFVWEPERASFHSEELGASGVHTVIREHSFNNMIPEPGKEQARINLWCMDSKAPSEGLTEVVLSNFRFTPPR